MERPNTKSKIAIVSLLVTEIIALGLLAIIFAVPLYSETTAADGTVFSYIMRGEQDVNNPITYVGIAFLVIYLLCLMAVIGTIPFFINNKNKFIRYAKTAVYLCLGVSLLFFIAGYVFQIIGTSSKAKDVVVATQSYVPFIIMCLPTIAFAVFEGMYRSENPSEDTAKKLRSGKYRVEPLIFVLLFTLGTMLSLFLNLIEMEFESTGYKSTASITGITLLRDCNSLGSGYQVLAFALIIMYIVSAIGLVLTLAGFFSKSKDYEKIAKGTSYINVFFVFLIAASGLYFTIAQKINEDNLKSVIEFYNINVSYEYTYKIHSDDVYVLIGEVALLALMIVRKSMQARDFDAMIQAADGIGGLGAAESEANAATSEVGAPAAETASSSDAAPSSGAVAESAFSSLEPLNFDPCPAFSELDSKKEQYASLLLTRQAVAFKTPTLSSVTQFVVDYARESRLHLSYSKADIATFLSGMGASRLAILQGMSGTGKTSLPKIFAEALCGTCDIVEVESSWKDKNELLGYYNEFSKTYTPKKFTCCLYKAALNPDVPTLIVLDEMNLSRIEYYFSDFLSLMENEEKKRTIKLLNVQLRRIYEGKKYDYSALSDANTLRIPTNVWFVGTANRDESTFEISDKVYDRAQTMNFNKRAPKVRNYTQPLQQRFVDYKTLDNLLSQAREQYDFDAEKNPLIQKAESILLPFNISFGNRILKQMEDFVKVYCRCFEGEDVVNEAIEKILLSKVVSKLETKIIENKDSLVQEFEKIGLLSCAEFVSKLNED